MLLKNVVKLDSVFSLLLPSICHEYAMRFQLSSEAQGIINKAHRCTRCTACSELPSHHTTSCVSSSCKGNMASALVFSFSPPLFPSLPPNPHHRKPAAAALSPDTLLVMDAVLSSDTLAASHYYVQDTAGAWICADSESVCAVWGDSNEATWRRSALEQPMLYSCTVMWGQYQSPSLKVHNALQWGPEIQS